jgi:carboxylesterase
MIFNPHLDGDPFLLRAGPVGVLLIHGLTATPAEVRPLAERLHSAGYTVAAPLLPGHYTHPTDLNKVKWTDWSATVENEFKQLKSICTRVIAGGESTGALLALDLAAKHQDIAALLLYAPALRLKLSSFDQIRLRLMAPFVPWLPKKNMNEGDSRWQGYFVNPLKGVVQLLNLQKSVRSVLPRVFQPVLIVQGRLDPTVHPEAPDIIYNEIKSTIKEQHWMPSSAHCVIIDCEMDLVTELTLAFLKKVLVENTEQMPVGS